MKEIWNIFIGIVVIIMFVGLPILFVIYEPNVKCDYTISIKVDDSSKVEWAISNAVKDVESRKFIVNKLDVTTWRNQRFTVTCGGIDKSNLLKR